MSGVEVAGLILAILPLCISALEHHRDELRHFKSLFRYHKEIERNAEDLGVAYVGFAQTITLVFEEAGVAESDQLERMVTSLDTAVWSDSSLESNLIAYFGRLVYEKRYKVVVQRILEGIKDIAGILGHEIKGNGSTDINMVWSSVRQRHKLPLDADTGKSDRLLADSVESQLKARAKYFIKSSQIGSRLEELERNIERLSETAEKAQKLSVISQPKDWKKPGFSAPAKSARHHISRLYKAFTGIKHCSSHPAHYLRLRFDPPDYSTSGSPSLVTQHTDEESSNFIVAFTPEDSSDTWHTLELHVEASQSVSVNRKVAFATPKPSSNSGRWQDIQGNLCSRLVSRSKTSLRIDPFSRLQEKIIDGKDPDGQVAIAKKLSLKRYLETSATTNIGMSSITTESALKLGYTLALAFVQLYDTPWMTDSWCADDVVFLQSSANTEFDNAYISTTMHGQGKPMSALGKASIATADDARRLLGLAVILLEIATRRPIEEWRQRNSSGTISALEEFTIVRRHFRDKSLINEPPCFQETIRYCLESYGLGLDLDLDDPAIFYQATDKIIGPIQRDLKSCLAYSG